jgi:hypothetical protein
VCNIQHIIFFFVTAADIDSQRALLDDRFVSARNIPGTRDNCRDFVVNRPKALLTNCLALCYDSWISRRHSDVLLFHSADRSWALISCIEQDGPVPGVSGFARFFHCNLLSPEFLRAPTLWPDMG